MPRLVPARLQFRDDGTPWSESFGDVYHSSAGGLAQAHSVFLHGNGLPERWRGRHHFCILETGFGLGLNFLATWAAWRADAQGSRRLHFVSSELHPFQREDLRRIHRDNALFAPLLEELLEHWPVLTPGFHRLHLDRGRVTLTLLLGDAGLLLPQLEARADAFYLDGFSPAVNPEMWSESLLQELPRLAAPGATLATWSVRGATRRALSAAGFECEKRPGFAAKREMLVGRFRAGGQETPAPRHHALVIGAGLAGSAIAHRLLARGWKVELIEQADGPGHGASGNHAGVLRPLPSLDDNRMSRLTRAGTLYGLHHLRQLGAAGQEVRWGASGVLHLARDEGQEAKQRAVAETLDDPPELLRYVDRDEASKIACWPLKQGGWWFSLAAWVSPPSLCAANLAGHESAENEDEDEDERELKTHYGKMLASLEDTGEEWIARAPCGREIARAPTVILANGIGIRSIAQADALPVTAARGQLSLIASPAASQPEVAICRGGYVSPSIDGLRSVGATFSLQDEESGLRESDHAENLQTLAGILPDYPAKIVGGRVGFRPASPDRLPIVGAVPQAMQAAQTAASGEQTLANLPRYRSLYAMSGFGARGLVWSALTAEWLASRLNDEPWPIERELAEAIDPGRYVLRPPGRKRPGRKG